jgi:hypothetical protein
MYISQQQGKTDMLTVHLTNGTTAMKVPPLAQTAVFTGTVPPVAGTIQANTTLAWSVLRGAERIRVTGLVVIRMMNVFTAGFAIQTDPKEPLAEQRSTARTGNGLRKQKKSRTNTSKHVRQPHAIFLTDVSHAPAALTRIIHVLTPHAHLII